MQLGEKTNGNKKENLKKSAKTVEATGDSDGLNLTAPAGGNKAPQPDPTGFINRRLEEPILPSIIDVASTRGAFKANEMAGVGTLIQQTEHILTNVQSQAPQQVGT